MDIDDAAGEQESNVFKILVATDIHLGFDEKDALRCKDSLNTFEEILQIAQSQNVDFLLLGGDLFHENKPSRWIFHECVRLLRFYCLSDAPVTFDFISDASVNFSHSQFPDVNYRDANLNVGLPVFTINGNHDDVTGQNLCALDILHESGLLNYFGKYTSVERIEVTPLILRKGKTKLALYGLGAVRDERLHRMFLQHKVKFLVEKKKNKLDKDSNLVESDEGSKDYFNLLVWHQNRVKHGATNYIPESFVPDFFDLVVWGHEHPCEIDPMPSENSKSYIMQPGSSVATSLAKGEADKKHVALVKIKNKQFSSEKIELRTVRQFYFEPVILAQSGIRPKKFDTVAKVEALLDERIESLLEKAENERSGHAKQPKEPLIRLDVDYTGDYDTFNTVKYGQRFVTRVANPKDLIIFHQKREIKHKEKLDVEAMDRVFQENAEDVLARVEDVIKNYFVDVEPTKQMTVLSDRGMGEALRFFVDKDEKESLAEIFKEQLKRCRQRVKKTPLGFTDENEIKKVLNKIHDLRIQNDKNALDEDQKDLENAMEVSSKKRKAERLANGGGEENGDADSDMEMDDEEENGLDASTSAGPKPKRGKGKTAAAAANTSTNGATRGRGRGIRGRRGGGLA